MMQKKSIIFVPFEQAKKPTVLENFEIKYMVALLFLKDICGMPVEEPIHRIGMS